MFVVFEKLQQLWQNPKALLKVGGVVVLLLIVLPLATNMFNNTVRSLGLNSGMRLTAPSMMMGGTGGSDGGMMYDEELAEGSMMKMGIANQAMPPRDPGYASGDDAEDYEITEYNANIRTNDKDPACTDIADLKALDYVIFENANEYDEGCSYTFKTDLEHKEEVLAVIEALDPYSLSENTYTIKRNVDYVTSEKEILEGKLASIVATLEEALSAYDEISRIATSTRDAESLASIIDSKVRLIERLTQERININEQLSRIERNLQQQMERLDYTYFYVSVYEDKYINLKDIKDSWKNAVQMFVYDANELMQSITIGVIGFILMLVQYVLYFFVLLYVAKFCWKHAKAAWTK